MIWLLSFFSFFFLSFKDFLFLTQDSCFSIFSIFLASICPAAYSVVSLFNKGSSFFETKFYSIFYFFIVLLSMFFFLASSGLLILFFIEVCAYPMSLLIIYFSKDPEKYLSVVFMLIINVSCSIPFMLFCASISNFNYSPSFFDSFWFTSDIWILVCFSLLFLCKLPMFMFHTWLTKAHVSASGPSSMILASLLLKLGSLGIFKFFGMFVLKFHYISSLFFSMGLTCSLFLVVLMIRFLDMKYMIACSSIFHMSMVYPLIMLGGSVYMLGPVIMMVGHGLVSYVLFMLVTLLYEGSNSRSSDSNKSSHSISKSIYVLLFIFLFLNLGFPPFLNFLSELYYFYSFLSYSYTLCLFFSLFALLSILFTIFFVFSVSFFKKLSYISKDMGSFIWPISLYFFGLLALVAFLMF